MNDISRTSEKKTTHFNASWTENDERTTAGMDRWTPNDEDSSKEIGE
jgi:hypothetical protein